MEDADRAPRPAPSVLARFDDLLRLVADDDAPEQSRVHAGAVLAPAFSSAVRRRFGEPADQVEVARYVAGLRTRLAGRGVEIRPLEVDAIIRRFCGDADVARGLPPESTFEAIMAVLPDLAADLFHTTAEVDAWLDEAELFLTTHGAAVAAAVDALAADEEG